MPANRPLCCPGVLAFLHSHSLRHIHYLNPFTNELGSTRTDYTAWILSFTASEPPVRWSWYDHASSPWSDVGVRGISTPPSDQNSSRQCLLSTGPLLFMPQLSNVYCGSTRRSSGPIGRRVYAVDLDATGAVQPTSFRALATEDLELTTRVEAV